MGKKNTYMRVLKIYLLQYYQAREQHLLDLIKNSFYTAFLVNTTCMIDFKKKQIEILNGKHVYFFKDIVVKNGVLKNNS